MFESITNKTQEILFVGTLFCSFMWLMVAQQLFSPEIAGVIGGGGYFIIIAVGVFGSTYLIEIIVNKHPYIRMITEPNNDEYDLFVKRFEKEETLEGGWHSRIIQLRFTEHFEEYGKIDEIKFLYRRKWADLMDFKPGFAFFKGIPVSHGQSETIIVYQTPRASVTVDHGKMIPTFTIHTASKPFHQMSDPLIETDEFAVVSKAAPQLLTRYKQLYTSYKNLQTQYNEALSRFKKSHKTSIEYEDVVEQQRTEGRGLLSAKTGVIEAATNIFLGFLHATKSFDDAIKMLQGPKETPWTKLLTNKWFVSFCLGFLGFIFLSLNPTFVTGFSSWMSNTTNLLILFGFAILAVIATYLIYLRKRSK